MEEAPLSEGESLANTIDSDTIRRHAVGDRGDIIVYFPCLQPYLLLSSISDGKSAPIAPVPDVWPSTE